MSTMVKQRDVRPETQVFDRKWMDLANCKDVDSDIFFPAVDELPSDDAVALCRLCPVREDCLQFALGTQAEGYWGGTTEAQRAAIMSGRSRVKCPGCGGHEIVKMDQTVCIACGLSW